MWAGTVVAPPEATSAAIVSVTSRSRSVALKASPDFSALISTLARIGIVLRRSTTRWTWPSDLNSVARSTVTFMSTPLGELQGASKVAWRRGFRKGERTRKRRLCPDRHGRRLGWSGDGAPGLATRRASGSRPAPRRDLLGEASLLQLPLEQLDLLGQRAVGIDQVFDLAHGVQHGGVVAAAEAPADLRQRAQRQRLRQIHRDLARAHDVGGAPGRQEVGAAHIVLPGDHPLNVLDLDAFGLLRADQIPHLALGHLERDRLPRELAVGEQAVERALEVAAVMGHGLGDESKHRRRNVEAGMMLLGGSGPAPEDFQAQLLAERTDLDHEPAGEPRAHALVQALEIGRRPIGGDHDLAAGVDERVERVTEFGLGRLALQELQVVDHQHVDGPQRLLE